MSWFSMLCGKVPRELFLPEPLREFAYENAPLRIVGQQTIFEPYIVAFMAEALLLRGGEAILEIGARSGYAAAVLSEVATDVYTVRRLGPPAREGSDTAYRTRRSSGRRFQKPSNGN